MKILEKLSSYASIVSFLALEVLAIVSFSLGNSIVLYGILGIALSLLVLLTSFKEIKKNGITNNVFYIFPAFVFSLLCCLSGFVTSVSSDWSNVIFTSLAVLSFAFSGYYLAFNKHFDLGKAMMLIYCGLFVFTIINLFFTIIDYVPFYTLIYKGAYIYYDGTISSVPVASMASSLFGLANLQTTLGYFSFAPVLLLTSSVVLFFTDFKKEKKTFVIYSLFSFVAFITLLFTVNKEILLMDVLAILIIGFFAICGKKKWNLLKAKKAAYVVLGIIAFAFLLLFINAQEWPFLTSIQNVVSSNSFLDRIFNNNKYVVQYNPILGNLCTSDGWLGTFVSFSYTYKSTYEYTALYPTNCFLIDAIMGGGIFGTAFLLLSLYLGYKYFFIYYAKSEESLKTKSMVGVFVITALIYFSFFYSPKPLIFDDYTYVLFFQSPEFLILIFLLGYTFAKAEKLLPKKEENKKEKENK